jgi:tetratricopeptide (TPR) repeat protein
MCAQDAFDNWVQQAEREILVSDEYPPIDSIQIDMADELQKVAHRVVEEYFGESSTSIPQEMEPTLEFLELQLIGSDGGLLVRFVILNFLYRLAHFTGFRSETSAAEIYGTVWPHFERFVRLHLQEVGTLKDQKAIRWEITNACAIRDWDVATLLFDLLKSRGAIAEAEYRGLKGQMLICSVAAPSDEQENEEELGVAARNNMAWWVLKLDRAFISDAFTPHPFGLMAWGLNLGDRTPYSAEECVRLSDAVHDWEISFRKNPDPLGSYRAAWGKAYFLLRDYSQAAKQFEDLLACDLGLPSEIEASIRPRLYQNAAECYAKGSGVEAAIRLLERCAQELPRTQGLWLKLAGLYLSSPLNVDLEKVRDCLRKEEEIDESFGNDPRTSIALMLGDLAADRSSATLRKVTEPNPTDLQFMTAVFSRHWPSFQFLDDESRRKWVGAARWLWGAGAPSWERAALRPRVVGIFADVVERQLGRLFDRFRQERGDIVLQKAVPDSKKEKFLKYLEGSYLTLGEMIAEIEGIHRLPDPRYPDLKAWLQRNARRLYQNWDAKPAWRLNELRRQSSHGGADISEQAAVELYDLSVWFINRIYGD